MWLWVNLNRFGWSCPENSCVLAVESGTPMVKPMLC